MEVLTSVTIEGRIVTNVGVVDGYTVYREEEDDSSGATLFFTKNGKVRFKLEVCAASTSQNFAFISDIDFKEIK